MAADPLTIIAGIRAAIALTSTLAMALERVQNGQDLTQEEQDAITASRKLVHKGLLDAIDRQLENPEQ